MLECFRYPLCPTVQSKVLGGKRRQESAAEGNTRVKYKVMDFPVSLPFQKPAPDKPNPKQGIDGSCLLLKDRESFCCSAVVSVLPDTSEGSSDGEDV
ncbi:hypothetical protein BHM03_00019211 [Ensete ventricosum]|nr:hypothetical protein BHM03_00019211 [Ensete ventricosum]